MIYKTELAQIYFPNLNARAAVKHLMRYCVNKKELKHDLEYAGFDFSSKSRFFTPKEVDIITSHLGKP